MGKLDRVVAEAYEGGGVLGVAYLPILEHLERERPQIHTHAGTSAGAITALLRALGLQSSEIRRVLVSTPWARFQDYNPGVAWRFLARGGVHSLSFPRKWLGDLIRDAAGHENLSFSHLKARKGSHSLIVAATRYSALAGDRIHRVTEASPFFFSPELTPDVAVRDAVLASMAVPLFWPPVEIDGWHFADGGVVMNHPISALQLDFAPEEMIGARVDRGREIRAELAGENERIPAKPTLLSILKSLLGLLSRTANAAHVPEELWARIVRIDVGGEKALDFGLTAGRIARFREAGSKAVAEWLSAPE